MYSDTRDKDPGVDFTKFQLWDTRWRIEHDKAQRSNKDLASTSSLPKRMRIAQASTSTQAEGAAASGAVASGATLLARA